MNLVKELEDVLKQEEFMGDCNNIKINLAVNAMLNKIEELGLDIVKIRIEEN
jgi:hypothetical protein